MANKPLNKMPIADRAKQFMPFAALTGLSEALRAQERIHVDRKKLSEEMLQELDAKMRNIRKGSIITVVYYEKGEYIQKTGMVASIETTSRIVQIVNTRIHFDDIVDVNPEA